MKKNDQAPRNGESATDHAYFVCYRNLSPQRSLARLISLDGIEPTSVYAHCPERMPTLEAMETLATRNGWAERARAWDRHLESLHQEPAPDPTDIRGQRRLDFAKSSYELGELFRRRLMEVLAFPATDTVLSEVEEVDAKGDSITTRRIISASAWTAKDVAMMAKASTDAIEHAARIMPWPTAEDESKEG